MGEITTRAKARRRGLRTAVSVAGALAVSAYGTAVAHHADASQSSGGKPISIGISLSLSGDFSADGQAFQRGYELWAAGVNAHGGLLGRKVKLVILSDASSPTQVVTNYQKLISVNHVDLIFGPYSTLLTVPASKIASRFGYAMVEGAGGGPAVFANGLHNVFDATLPVANDLAPFARWIASMPAATRPKTVAYATSDDPFTQPQIPVAHKILEAAGVKTVYNKVFPAEVTDFTPVADAVASSKADIVVLGSVDVPTVSAFVQAFAQAHYNPKAFVSSAGPDQGQAFVQAVGAANTEGMMVPNEWYPGLANASSQAMVKAYVAKYGGSPSGVNADVAEAYAVGQTVFQAVSATRSLSNTKVISYLHSGVTLKSVQGPVKFNSAGQNNSGSAFVFQWQKGVFVQALPVHAVGSKPAEYPKQSWAG